MNILREPLMNRLFKFQSESFLFFTYKAGQRGRSPTTKNYALQPTTISGVANVNRPMCNGWSQLGEASFVIKAFPVLASSLEPYPTEAQKISRK
ncbi:hypothetical protein TNIN_151831 [Trichonephila inaurata madagascariensis]|uniref:Uncharacterized protein n=1 Tax=Trichonephila inaurata madagascariensis TaxID=2747483 RepID=A0A8X6WLV2_9ARAC|nr:hypothetical protein TNIN_151831 [Trichonephila inaurata madagascariensis]